MLEKPVKAAEGKVKLVTMNVDEHPESPASSASDRFPPSSPFSAPSRWMVSWARCRKARSGFIERLVGPLAGEAEELSRRAKRRLPPGDAAAAAEYFGALSKSIRR